MKKKKINTSWSFDSPKKLAEKVAVKIILVNMLPVYFRKVHVGTTHKGTIGIGEDRY